MASTDSVNRPLAGSCEHDNELPGEFLDQLSD